MRTPEMLVRCRLYTVISGKTEAFNSFFRSHLFPLQQRYGATLIGRWQTEDGGRILALWAYRDRTDYETIQAQVRADPAASHNREYRDVTLGPLYTDCDEFFLDSTVPLEQTALAQLALNMLNGSHTREGDTTVIRSKADFPILEFDPSPTAVIEPKHSEQGLDMPEAAVVCFFQDVIAKLLQDHEAKLLFNLASEIGLHPIYEIEHQGKRVAVFHPGVGAPLAAGLLEEVIALGCRKFIACGGCGVLDSTIALGHVLVPQSAVRDEGTSYHYLPPSREVSASPSAVAAIERTLQAHGTDYLLSKTWTTDALYRETPDKVKRRRDEGCLTVEMEAAAFFAVAQFRGVEFGQLLYGGDDVGGNVWDHRDWNNHLSGREKLFWLAAEACLML